jgi:hypothetical protein
MQYQVVFARVAVRSSPNIVNGSSSNIVGVRYLGDTVRVVRRLKGWVQLLGEGLAPGGWLLIDGTALGLGVLLEAVIVAPTLLTEGQRAVLIALDLECPLTSLLVWCCEGDAEARERVRRVAIDPGAEDVRIGGLEPGKAYEIAGAVVLYPGDEEAVGPRLRVRTTHQPTPDPAHGVYQTSFDVCDEAELDCPGGWLSDSRGGLLCASCLFPRGEHTRRSPGDVYRRQFARIESKRESWSVLEADSVWVVSDVHTDVLENMEWVKGLPAVGVFTLQ